MLTYLVTAPFTDTVEVFLDTWGRELRGEVEVVTFDDFFAGRPLRTSGVIFSDLERLSEPERALAETAWQQLAALEEPPALFNRPSRVRSRLDLLELLHRDGGNAYGAVPLRQAPGRVRYPVFVRHAREHWGALTELLEEPRALERELVRAWLLRRLDTLLAVEFCDTSDASGLYRKYAAFVIRDAIVPRHLIFDQAWQLKTPQLIDDGKVAEELRYLEENPHEQELLRVARLAGVDYGRFDYALLDGRIQIWEVNTNPILMMHPDAYRPEHLPAQEWFASRIGAALRRAAPGPAVSYRWTGPVRRAAPPAAGARSPLVAFASDSRPVQRGLRAASALLRPIVVRRLTRG
jgi:hypothetical protein